jgi:hypothetical protein
LNKFNELKSDVFSEDELTEDIREISAKIISKHAFVWGFGGNKDGELGIGN